MSTNQKTQEVSPFALKMDSGFSSRADDIFGTLGNIEAKHEAFLKVQSRPGRSEDSLCKEDPKEDKVISTDMKNQRSWSSPQPHSSGGYKRSSAVMKQEFKPPRGPPPPRTRGGSRNRLDPSRWTYYNLSDVSADDLSERSNTAAAMSFLRSRSEESAAKKLKTGEEEATEMEVEVGDGSKPERHVFKKSKRREEGEAESKKPQVQIAGRPGCVVMPEYTVGHKPTSKDRKKIRESKKSKSGAKGKTTKEIAISHLMAGDDEEDDDNDEDMMKSSRPLARAGSESPNRDMDEDVEMDDIGALHDPLGLFSKKRNTFQMGRRDIGGNDDSSDENDEDNINRVSIEAAIPDSDSTNVTDLSELSSLDPKDLDLDGVD